MNKKVVSIAVAITLSFLLSIFVYETLIADKLGPTIQFTKDAPVYHEGDDDSVLLDGVKATDKHDGDVTQSVCVKSKTVLKSKDKMVVRYAARDQKNNVTIKERTVGYVPSADSTIGAQSQTSSNDETTKEETTQEETTVPELSTADIDKAKADATGIPAISLVASELTIKAGTKFLPMSQVKETYDSTQDVSKRVKIVGTYDYNVPGDYVFSYVVSDTDGNVSEPKEFTLHVKAK